MTEKQVYPFWEIRGRWFTDLEVARDYWDQFGGWWMEKLDSHTLWYARRRPEDHPGFLPPTGK